jgi:hypothetical protein
LKTKKILILVFETKRNLILVFETKRNLILVFETKKSDPSFGLVAVCRYVENFKGVLARDSLATVATLIPPKM